VTECLRHDLRIEGRDCAPQRLETQCSIELVGFVLCENSSCYLYAGASGDNSVFVSDRYAFLDKEVDGLHTTAKDSNNKWIPLQTVDGLKVSLKVIPPLFATKCRFEELLGTEVRKDV
jgi:hypothetical protein